VAQWGPGLQLRLAMAWLTRLSVLCRFKLHRHEIFLRPRQSGEAWMRHRVEVLEGSTGRGWQGRRGELGNNFGEHMEVWWQAQATAAMSSSSSAV
jgi:hypothetical protein